MSARSGGLSSSSGGGLGRGRRGFPLHRSGGAGAQDAEAEAVDLFHLINGFDRPDVESVNEFFVSAVRSGLKLSANDIRAISSHSSDARHFDGHRPFIEAICRVLFSALETDPSLREWELKAEDQLVSFDENAWQFIEHMELVSEHEGVQVVWPKAQQLYDYMMNLYEHLYGADECQKFKGRLSSEEPEDVSPVLQQGLALAVAEIRREKLKELSSTDFWGKYNFLTPLLEFFAEHQ